MKKLSIILLSILSFNNLNAETVVHTDNKTANQEKTLIKEVIKEVGGNFKLIDQEGKEFDNTKSDKKYSLVFFGYGTCKSVCPTAMNDLSQVLAKNQKALDKIQPVFISLDPNKDTPALLKNFGKPYDKSILFLTSLEKNGEEYINKLVSQYKVYSSRIKLTAEEKKQLNEDNDYTISHTSLFYLIDNKTGLVLKFSPDDQNQLKDLLNEYGK